MDNLTALQDQQAFLSKVMKTIQFEWNELCGHLQQAEWPQAREKAHQLRGIFYLLEADALLISLQHIENVNLPLIAQTDFREQLQQQIDLFCGEIGQYVDR